MGYDRLCRIRKADRPFYIEAVGINITAYEELCWYISENPALLDEDLFSEALVRFVAQEWKLTSLAVTMEKALADQDMPGFFLPILKEDAYLPQREFQIFERRFRSMLEAPDEERMRRKGDALVRAGRLSVAIRVYREILKGETKLSAPFAAAVYRNMGVAYTRLFRYREAVPLFEKAYSLNSSRDDLKACLYACALSFSREKYEEKLQELGVDRETQKEVMETVLRESSSVTPEETPDPEAFLSGLTREYHRAVEE